MQTPLPIELVSAAHYHQEARQHPTPFNIPTDHLLIEIVTSGQGAVRHQNTWTDVNPGTLLWLIPGDQTIARSNFEDPYRCLSLFFKIQGIKDRAAPHQSQWLELDQVRTFTKDIVQLSVDESFDRTALGLYAYSRALYQSTLNEYKHHDDRYPIGIRKALSYIDTHLGQNIKIQDIATAADWSMPHLSDMFNKYLDDSPHQLLLKRRIRAARERLNASNEPIKSIAAECGFSSPAAFCHSFKSRTGETPASYRRRQLRL